MCNLGAQAAVTGITGSRDPGLGGAVLKISARCRVWISLKNATTWNYEFSEMLRKATVVQEAEEQIARDDKAKVKKNETRPVDRTRRS